MNHKDRVFTTLSHNEPDKVPKGEIGIAPDLVSRMLGDQQADRHSGLMQCLELLKMDIINTSLSGPPSWEIGRDSEGRLITEDAWGLKRVHQEASEKMEPAIHDIADVQSYEVPTEDMYDPSDTKWWADESDYFIFGQTGGCHDNLLALFGWENAMVYSQIEPDVMKDLAKRIGELHAQLGRKLAESGADLVLVADDLAFNSGTFFSPTSLRKLIFPILKEEVREIKKSGVPVMLHSDGNLNDVMDDLIDCGFDGLQSLQPSAGMDIGEIKDKYGKKLTLMGNLDLDYLLPFGTTEEVRAEVRSVIKSAAPGGGFILSTCNILTRDIPVENALAMYDEAERSGWYANRT